MSELRRTRAILIRLQILFGLLGAVHGHVFAQGSSVEVPENAHAKSYRNGWECNKGYQELNEGCEAVKVPENAFPTNKSYGRGWECNREYRAVDNTCVAVKVPANGYFMDVSYGVGWKCDRGYRKVDEACVTVEVPANAHLDYSGNDWECNRPYREQQDECALP